MLKVAEIIFQTCPYLSDSAGQIPYLSVLFIAVAMSFYFLALKGETVGTLLLVLFFSIVGIAGSYSVALVAHPRNTYQLPHCLCITGRRALGRGNIPLRAGMSVGLFLISLGTYHDGYHSSLVPRDIVGTCFLGFAC